MNFFGHYFTDSIAGRPWFNLGLVFPDLYRDLIQKKIPNRSSFKNPSPEINDFFEGIEAHLSRDKMFHNCEYFHLAEKVLKAELKTFENFEIIPRAWFLTHIMLELVTDKYLVISFPEQANSFYKDLGIIENDSNTIDGLFDDLLIKTVFLTRLNLIKKDRFIFAYANNEKLVVSLFRIYQRAGIEMSKEIKEEISKILLTVLPKLDHNPAFNWANYITK